MRLTLAVLIATATPSLQAGELFKWIDPASGAAVYSNDPPPAAVKSLEEKRIVRSTIETSSMPYGVRQAVKRSPIVLYVTDCGEFCKDARAYLAKRGVPFTERNPEQPEHAEQLKKIAGGALEVPFLMVGTKAVRGFDEAQYAAALEAAGYPKSSLAALGPRPVPPKTPIPVANETQPGVQDAVLSEEGGETGRAMAQQPLASGADPF
jgi:glutaredoxin